MRIATTAHRMITTTGNPRHPISRDGFALLLTLVVISALGSAVLGTQVVARQRLAAAVIRNQIYQRRIAADAAVLHLMAGDFFHNAGESNLLVDVPLPGQPVLAMTWDAAPVRPFIPPDAMRIQTAFHEAGDPARGHGVYLVRQAAGQWQLTRWSSP